MICPICGTEFSDESCPVCGRTLPEQEHLYQTAMNLMNDCHTSLGYRGIAVILTEISDYKDAQENIEKCLACSKQIANSDEAAGNRNHSENQRRMRRVASMIGIAICIVIVSFIIAIIGNYNAMKRTLVGEWYAPDGTILKVLDIQDDEIVYRVETDFYWLDRTLGTFDWKPAFRNQIKVKLTGYYKTYRISLNDAKNVLTIYPAITSPDRYETWYSID